MQDDMETAVATKAKGARGRKAGAKAAGGAAGKAGKTGPKAGAKAAAKAAGEKGQKNPDVQIARMLVRAQWQQEWVAANPETDQAARKAAWQDARQPRMDQYLKSARKVLSNLQRQGVTMILSAKAAAAGEAEVDVEDDEDTEA